MSILDISFLVSKPKDNYHNYNFKNEGFLANKKRNLHLT